MTQDEIIEIANEAFDESSFTDAEVLRFAALVAAKVFQDGYEKGVAVFNEAVWIEREACAKVCDELSNKHTWEGCYADECAHAIRARGNA